MFSSVKTQVKKQTHFLVNVSQGLSKDCRQQMLHFVTVWGVCSRGLLRHPCFSVLLRGVEKRLMADTRAREAALKQTSSFPLAYFAEVYAFVPSTATPDALQVQLEGTCQ